MGEFKAGGMFVLMIIYFIVFIASVSLGEQINQESSEINVESQIEGLEGYYNDFSKICITPRFEYDPDTADITESNDPNNLLCEKSKGVLSKTICESIEGCSWENVTNGFWFWKSTEPASCLGNINGTAYGIETKTFLGQNYVSDHNNTEYFEDNYNIKNSVCTHPNVIKNKTLCDTFSCSYNRLDTPEPEANLNSIKNSVGDIFTFRHDFGFESTTAQFFGNLLFVVLPLIMLAISIYFMLPVVH